MYNFVISYNEEELDGGKKKGGAFIYIFIYLVICLVI